MTVSIIFAVLIIAGTSAVHFHSKQQRELLTAIAGKKENSGYNFPENEVLYNGKKYKYNDHLSNFLFMGVDKRELVETTKGRTNAGQTDAIYLLSWDRVEHTIKTLGIPRDTMTKIEVFGPGGQSFGMSRNHISLAFGFGDGGIESCELVKKAVSNLLDGLPIQGYCAIDLDGIALLPDSVGGIIITVPDDSLEAQYPEFQEGREVTLTGENTEAFVRYRDTTKRHSALVRQERQGIFLKAFAQKAAEVFQQDSSFITRLYNNLDSYMITNMGNDLFVKLGEDGASGNAVETYTLPGNGVEGKNFDEYEVDEEAMEEMLIQLFYLEA